MEGNFVIEPMFDRAFTFRDGLALIRVGSYKTGMYGYIDKKGEIGINPQFYGAHHFSEGLACVKDSKEGKWGYVNTKGEVVIGYLYDIPADFAGGLAKVRVGNYKSGTNGYIDKTGKWVWQGGM